MNNVNFVKMTSNQFDSLAEKDQFTFYFIADENKLYLGNLELTITENLLDMLELVNDEVKGNENIYDILESSFVWEQV